MKIIPRFIVTACLALAAHAASAIPLQVNVDTLGLAAGGEWELTGPTSDDGLWGGVILGSQTWNLDIAPGAYLWEISGAGLAAGVTWNLVLAGGLVHSGSGSSLGFFTIADRYEFVAEGVPEPGTLAMLGLGLAVIGFAAGRRRRPNREA